MIEQKVKERIATRLFDSRLKQVIGQETAALLAEKPPDVDGVEFCAYVAELIVGELHHHLCSSVDLKSSPLATKSETSEESSLDFDLILRGLVIGLEYDLLVGNLQMVRALGEAIAQRDTGNSRHNQRVVLYSIALAEAVGLDREEMRALMKGSFLHDIGKIGIADSILLKGGDLTSHDRQIINAHPELGAKIIGGVNWLEEGIDVVRYHHERYDGSGYPRGLAGDAIPLSARIFAVVDVFDALASERSYKKAFPYEEVMTIIERKSSGHFDPEIANTFGSISRSLYDEFAGEPYDALQERLRGRTAVIFDIDPRDLT